jgi:hypothetical protein
MKITKATPEEKALYAQRNPVYPLYGFVINKEGLALVIEDLRSWPKGDPQYEVMAPDGMSFDLVDAHSLLCTDLKDLRNRVAIYPVGTCTCDQCLHEDETP